MFALLLLNIIRSKYLESIFLLDWLFLTNIGKNMYNDIIISNFSDPKHASELKNPEVEFEIGNPVCGDRIKIQLLISKDTIKKAVFKAWGCATSVATANIFCNSIEGNEATSCSQRSSAEIKEMLGELEPSQHHCLNILNELHEKLTEIIPIGAA